MTPSDVFDAAQRLIREGQPDQAATLLSTSLDDRRCAARLRELLIGERRLPQAAQIAQRLASGDDAEARVGAAFLRHLANDFASAAQLCQQALQLSPEHPAALNHLGRALHNMGRTEDALQCFERALQADPGYSEGWHNLGHVLRARGQLHRAQQAFATALEHAPGYRSARVQLGVTYYASEQPVEALACFDAVLATAPDEVEALVGAGLASHLLGKLDDALRHYRHALQIDPQHATCLYYLGSLLNEAGDSRGAIAALNKALQLQPGDVDAWTELAGVYEQDSQLDAAANAVDRGLAVAPQHPPLVLEAAKLARRRGDVREAINRLRRIDPRRLPMRTAQQYWFELGNALDRSDDVAGAMKAFEAGNALAARSVRRQDIDPAAFDRTLDRLLAWTRAGAPGHAAAGDDPADDGGLGLCFLVGMPRSGTTLLDTMLAAHPDVASIEELPTLEPVIDELQQLPGRYPDALASIDARTVHRLRKRYRVAVASHLGERRPALIVDKLPLRCLHAGLIHRLFPRARVLFALRHPGDVVLSNFMQQYAPNEAFIHFDTLADSARVYARVLDLWQASLAAFPLRHDYVRYEALIASPADELARVCDFLGIGFDPAMLDDDARQATRERVRTNSYQQVAEPIYQRASGRWQRYRPYLEPVIEQLQPHAERLGYAFE